MICFLFVDAVVARLVYYTILYLTLDYNIHICISNNRCAQHTVSIYAYIHTYKQIKTTLPHTTKIMFHFACYRNIERSFFLLRSLLLLLLYFMNQAEMHSILMLICLSCTTHHFSIKIYLKTLVCKCNELAESQIS